MWVQVKRVIKSNGAIVRTASQTFTTTLIASNMKDYKYNWVWNKAKAANYVLAKRQPLKIHEDVVVFNSKQDTYFPQMVKGKFRKKGGYTVNREVAVTQNPTVKYNDLYYPKSILEISVAGNKDSTLHPTQKPVALMEYLIKTYTNEGETVLDFTMGSGTTGAACKNLSRNFIGIELDKEYFEIAKKRIMVQ